MTTYTFKTVDGGVAMFKKDVAGVTDGFHTSRFRPIMSANNSIVSFDAGKFSYNIDVTANTVIIDKTDTGGVSTTYAPGDISDNNLHKALNVVYGSNFLTA